MYSQLARAVPGLLSRATIRSYATRRIITEAPSNQVSPNRFFQSTRHTPGQLHVESPNSSPFRHETHGAKYSPTTSKTSPFLTSEAAASEPPHSRLPVQPDNITSAIQFDEQVTRDSIRPLHHRGTKFERLRYWQKIPRWKDVTVKEFLTHSWQINKNIQGSPKLYAFLTEVLPSTIPTSSPDQTFLTRDEFIHDVAAGIKDAPMSIRLTPHILSCIDWENPLNDPLRRQFIPMKSSQVPDHPKLTMDSLHEADDSPVKGLVHRYPDKVLFLATSVCGLYCRFCTRSYAVGGNTETVTKTPNKPIKARWDEALDYVRANPTISDVVVSGGDSYYLLPEQLQYIGQALLSIPSIQRFRIATKGLCVSPSRTLDKDDTWTDTLIGLSNEGRKKGVQVALHTHFNHPNEISWVTREAAQRLMSNGVVVRNQSVLLRGVNDDVHTMGKLIRELADMNIQPYYIYQCDLVPNIEDLRTPLSTILHIEQQLRGSIAGFMVPSFVVDLPGGGGKRLATSYQSYDKVAGRSTFIAPAIKGEAGSAKKEGRVYEYWDPIAFVGDGGAAARGDAAESEVWSKRSADRL